MIVVDASDPLGGRWYDLEEAAELAGVSLRTITRWIQSGKLPITAGCVNAIDVVSQSRCRSAGV